MARDRHATSLAGQMSIQQPVSERKPMFTSYCCNIGDKLAIAAAK
jgi:hypothetical protein